MHRTISDGRGYLWARSVDFHHHVTAASLWLNREDAVLAFGIRQ